MGGFESTATGSLFSWQNAIASLGVSALHANERALAQIDGQRMTATVVLIKALGGGWS
jgi:hypothetical protein